MADYLSTGMAKLEEIRKGYMASNVTYKRGSNTVTVAATKGRSVRDEETESGVMLRHEIIDFLIATADLILSGSQVEPEVGDQILETVGSVVLTYKVVPLETEGHFRYSDPQRNTLRIHTKLWEET